MHGLFPKYLHQVHCSVWLWKISVPKSSKSRRNLLYFSKSSNSLFFRVKMFRNVVCVDYQSDFILFWLICDTFWIEFDLKKLGTSSHRKWSVHNTSDHWPFPMGTTSRILSVKLRFKLINNWFEISWNRFGNPHGHGISIIPTQ